jgi:flavin-dependent dehydrogenase
MAAGVEILVGRVTGAGRIDRNGAHRMVVETSCEACPHIVASVAIDATGRPAALARRLGADQAMKQRLIAELLPDGEHSRFADAMSGWLHIASERDSWTFALAGPQDTRQQWRIAPQRGGSPNVPRYCLDASPRQLPRAAGIAWLAVGDAALAFDPITSQGLFNALSTALIVTGILQADAVLSEETANDYSACIQAVASLSDAIRKEVYASLL